MLSRGETPLPSWWRPSWWSYGSCPALRGQDSWPGAGSRQHLIAAQPETVDRVFSQEGVSGQGARPPFLLSRLAVRLPQAVEEVTDELIPEEHEARGEGGLQQAGGQAFEEALGALLSQHLPGAVQEALVASNLAKGGSGLLKPSDLQPFLEEVQGVRQGLANDSSSTATKQVFEVS